MKKKSLIFIPLTAAILMSSFSLFFISSPAKTTSVPQAIDATDLDEEEIKSYYQGITNLSGNKLLTSLSDIIDEHTSINYNDAYDWMAITDRDWIQSPLSENELASYDFSNLANDNPVMHLMYRNDNYLPSASRYYANVSKDEKSFDREHVWSQNRGGFDTSEVMGTDMHHLFASDEINNHNGHNNRDYGNVDVTSKIIGNNDYNTTGKTGTQSGSSISIYEPHDDVKGDIARALFYMAVRYDETLTLTREIQNDTTYFIGNLDVLLEWNKSDPVDVFEIHRNNLIYNNIQHNRNPFIDFPDWADAIWGEGVANVSEDTPSLIDNVIDLRPSRNGRLVIEHLPNKIAYTRGEALDVTGLVVSYEHDGTRETITDYVLSIKNQSLLSNPGSYRVFISSKLEGVIYTYFDIYVSNTQLEIPIQTVIYSTGFEESEGFSLGTNYQGNVTSGPSGQQWNIDGNFSKSKAGSINESTARFRYYYNSTKLSELKMEFDVSYASSIKFDTKMNANLTLDAFYSLDSGVTYNYLKQDDGSDFKNVNTTRVRTYELDVPGGNTCETVRFKFALGGASVKPGSSSTNYELSIDNIYIYGENYATPFDDFLAIKDLPRTLTYEVGDTFTSENLLVNRLSYSAPTSNFYDYTLSIEDGVILNTPGQIRVDVNPLDPSIKSTHFYITVIGELSPAQAFANKLATYKTCEDYIEAYEALINEYNALSDADKEALKDIIIYDYDYQEYLNNNKSYEGLNPTSQIDAHTKWMQIIAMYYRANSATWVSSLFTNPQTYLTLLYIALAIGAITITVYFISKKHKQIR